MTLRAADFDFELPPELIAQAPAEPRDSARLLVVADTLSDSRVRDLPDLLRPGDRLVVNNTRVIPAQLTARRGAARIGITLDRPLDGVTWHALARNARRLKPGDTLDFEGDAALTADVAACPGGGSVHLRFHQEGEAFLQALRACAALALPPYIKRPEGPVASDASDYQTMFARVDGAVAAPTAGLHFTPALEARLAASGIARSDITLHVGAGTFLPMREDQVSAHTLHAERCHVPQSVADEINATRAQGGRIVAVGTTSLRTLETACDNQGRLHSFEGETDIFIKPGMTLRAADLLMTNFHLPRSTLFMLVCAFSGTDRMRAAYAHAIARAYRFFSYGDACLLARA